ncbi:hypothetical protein Cni_G25728 [Canna indica]|uniref:serine C-palmitoyltransferase n=1 Tax=Canna indica TaxID=4628 RepID=A0AAQ3KYF8_9LILI|nr:hypothetical protein Cni_G25728 [Canna indica]
MALPLTAMTGEERQLSDLNAIIFQSGLINRAKQRWLKEGDRNSRFFHQWASVRKRSNWIHSLISEEGTLYGDDAIAMGFGKVYVTLLGAMLIFYVSFQFYRMSPKRRCHRISSSLLLELAGVPDPVTWNWVSYSQFGSSHGPGQLTQHYEQAHVVMARIFPLPPIPPLFVPREVRRVVRLTYLTALTTLFSYGVFLAFGLLRDLFRRLLLDERKPDDLKGYAPICPPEDFYTRRIYHRIQDCFGRPIASAPDAWIDVVDRYSNDNNKTLHRTSNTSRCLNLGSYNYLGFAAGDEYCTPRVIESLKQYAPTTCSARADAGTTKLHIELEELIARFVGKPAAITFGMGYVTNSSIIPSLVGEGGLIISDSFNHNSIVNGARASGATIEVFQHNSKFI